MARQVPLKKRSQPPKNPDGKIVFLSKRRHGIVVIVSPPQFPDVVAEECRKAAQMRSRLGDLSTPILAPLDTGHILGSAFAVLPYLRPLSLRRAVGRLDERLVKHHLLDWLLQVARRHSAPAELSRYRTAFLVLADAVTPGGPAAAMLRMAQAHLMSGRFAALSTPMHGDLWKGNVLHGTRSVPFAIVDWGGCSIEGYPLFDLIRVAESFHVSPATLRRQLLLHRAALGCEMEDLPLYLLGALGHFAERLGEMPLACFQAMADHTVLCLSSALEAAGSSRLGRLIARLRNRDLPPAMPSPRQRLS